MSVRQCSWTLTLAATVESTTTVVGILQTAYIQVDFIKIKVVGLIGILRSKNVTLNLTLFYFVVYTQKSGHKRSRVLLMFYLVSEQ